ncbi:MAG: DUF4197 domain-containing protein, partial [Gammaproteobacteria bacterium]|nr:DUF4197 domain-containing protein [Gammaproteobacteria bacterium]
ITPAFASDANQSKAVHEALNQAADVAINRLGRTDGFLGDPRVRIGLPEDLARIEKTLRRYGFERYVEEFVQSINHAAEAAMPAAKPIVLQAVRDMTLTEAAKIIRGSDDAATEYFRRHTESALTVQLRPTIAQATARSGVAAAYKRMLRKVSVFEKVQNGTRLDLDEYITHEALDGLYRVIADEEKRIRREPVARTTEILRSVFR